jgi:Sensors of blue-light using FAD
MANGIDKTMPAPRAVLSWLIGRYKVSSSDTAGSIQLEEATLFSMSDLIRQVLYISKSTRAMSDAELHDIASKARLMNERQGITGALLFVENSFVQVIEGEDAPIERLLAALRGDIRHRDLTILMDRKVACRDFENWSMGIITISEEKKADVVREIHSADTAQLPADNESEFFPDSQTFLMMKHVYETNQSLQQARVQRPG